jgi:hypothetical protein
MLLNLLLIADYVNITADGKLNVMGIFNSIHSTEFPTAHPEMFLIAKFSTDPSEYGTKKKLAIKLLDEGGKPIASLLEHEIEIPHGKGGRVVEIRQLLKLTGLVFPQPGAYHFSILVDNDQKGSQTIQLIQIPKEKRS